MNLSALALGVVVLTTLLYVGSASANHPAGSTDSTQRGPATVVDRGSDGESQLRFLDPGNRAGSGDRLGLHVTAEELEFWRERWDGPGSVNDAFLQARIEEERSRVLYNRDRIMNESDKSKFVWEFDMSGADTDSDGNYIGRPSNVSDTRRTSAYVRDLAFYALVTEDATAMGVARDLLVETAGSPAMQFNQQPPWGPMAQSMRDANYPAMQMSYSMLGHLFAWDYVNIAIGKGLISDVSSARRSQVANWHKGFAEYVEPANTHRANIPFLDRLGDDYSLTSRHQDPDNIWGDGNLWQGGPTNHRGHNIWRGSDMNTPRFMTAYALMYDDQEMRDLMWRRARDWVRYAVYPHGGTTNHSRGWGDATGFSNYAPPSHEILIFDLFARAGDTSLYDYETTTGTHDSAGSPQSHGFAESGKSLQFIIRMMARLGNESVTQINTNEEKYNFRDGSAGNMGAHDTMIPANLYYQDDLAKDFYRGENGQPDWITAANARRQSTGTPIAGGNHDLNNGWAWPAPYMQWAGLEGKVWPYPVK